METKKLYSKGEEITNSILHGIGLGFAIAALTLLVVLASNYGDVWYVVSFAIYGSTLIILYLSSTLYHSFPVGSVKDIFQVFDHASIYLLIAGTYTPLTLIPLRGKLGWSIFGIVWGIALIGIVFKIFFVKKFVIMSTILYIVMGWLIIIAIKPLINTISTISIVFLVLGGIFYTVGTIFFINKKIKFNHAIWHLFVLAGSACHFFTILFLLPNMG
ncbi:hemolysin III family protein [Clostridium sp. D2Q-14]|uniref:PAQR family membrane homeostasis protein TrhA n=1 Tax=Anaeromonas gelatinilytica TaxID=2683194 RepID=UPI00193BBF11|nr:hemolysin III family protein [Anaeromonas gelatinilytica]MBS4534311.1 hemolysin III family protein [Anaeromonas gelatinilytica]